LYHVLRVSCCGAQGEGQMSVENFQEGKRITMLSAKSRAELRYAAIRASEYYKIQCLRSTLQYNN
jgi:hypothetical protein